MNNKVIYRGKKGSPQIVGIFDSLASRIIYDTGEFGGVISYIAAESSGTGSLTFTTLSGISITTCSGTNTPYIDGNAIIFPLGVYWDLHLSDGTYIPDLTTGYDVSILGTNGESSGLTITNVYNGGTQYFAVNGFNIANNTLIPATQVDTLIDVLGNDIVYFGIQDGVNLCKCIIRLRHGMFDKRAVEGNLDDLDEIWKSDTVWDYYDSNNPTDWTIEELSMSYVTSRLSTAYTNTIFIREIRDINNILIGIDRIDILGTSLSSEDASKLTNSYAGSAFNVLPINKGW